MVSLVFVIVCMATVITIVYFLPEASTKTKKDNALDDIVDDWD